jgi:hypothetical protein
MPGDAAGVAMETPPFWALSLAKMLHLEWCAKCGDWRDLGHTDPNPTLSSDLEEEDFPTIG